VSVAGRRPLPRGAVLVCSAVSTMSIMGKPRGGMPRARAGTRLAGGAGRGVVRFRQSCPGRRGSVPCPRASARRRPWRG
jgi:hypothetical protein